MMQWKLIQWETWCSLAGSAFQVRVAWISLACSAFRAFVAIFTATNLSRLHRANRTGDPGVLAHLRHDKTADLPLLQGAELAPGCHLLPGSRWGGRWSTIQLAEGGNPFLPPNSGHLPPSRRWRWRLVVMKQPESLIIRLWRVPATLPYPDLIFTTRTLPGKVLKISGFRVVTIHAVSTQDYINDASYLAPEGRDSLS